MSLYRRVLPSHEYAALDAWLSQFYSFQLRWMLDSSKRAACVKARQIGWSHTTGGNAVLWGAIHGELTTIVSRGEQESLEVLEKARRHVRVLAGLGSTAARLTKDTAKEIGFPSGGRILALPSTGGRGYTGNLILDEFAYHQHAEETWDAAVPAMRLGDFKLRVISTPNGKGNAFGNLIDAIRSGRVKRTKLYQVTIDDAERDGFPVNIDECWEDAQGDPRLFEQLYRCSFLDNELQYIPTEAIELCSSDDDLSKSAGDAHYAGLDIGRENDRTVLIVVRFNRGIRTVVHVESMKRTEFEVMQARVSAAFSKYQLKRLCIDATGLGMESAERLKRKHSERVDVAHRRPRVEPITFTPKSKEMLATGLYTAMTSGQVVLPKTDAALPQIVLDGHAANVPGTAKMLQSDVAALRRSVTKAGNVTYDAPRTAEGHADSAWALALAVHASTGRNAMAEALLGQR
jgi:phage FluMu gp28-like protein